MRKIQNTVTATYQALPPKLKQGLHATLNFAINTFFFIKKFIKTNPKSTITIVISAGVAYLLVKNLSKEKSKKDAAV
jgi:hypothetical protein